MISPRRGEVYWIDWSPSRGSEQAGRRPGVVISNDFVNRRLPVVTVAAVTTRIRDENSPIALVLPAGQPLPERSCVLAFQVMTVDQARLDSLAGILSADQIVALDQRLRNVWF